MKSIVSIIALAIAAPVAAQSAAQPAAQTPAKSGPTYDQGLVDQCLAADSTDFEASAGACTRLLATPGMPPAAVVEARGYRANKFYDAALRQPRGSARRKALLTSGDADVAFIVASPSAASARKTDAFVSRAYVRMIGDEAGSIDADLDRALALTPSAYFASFLRAQRREEAKNYGGAIADLDNGLATIAKADTTRLSPSVIAAMKLKNAEMLNSRCWIRAAWLNTDLSTARTDCNAAIAIEPEANTYDSLGMVELRARNWDAATKAYGMAASKEPKMASAWYGLGIAETRLGMGDYASAHLTKAIQIDPGIAQRYAEKGLKP